MKFTNKNWLKVEQLEIQTPLKKKKIKIQTDPTSTSTSWSVVSIINKEWIYDIDISRIELYIMKRGGRVSNNI